MIPNELRLPYSVWLSLAILFTLVIAITMEAAMAKPSLSEAGESVNGRQPACLPEYGAARVCAWK